VADAVLGLLVSSFAVVVQLEVARFQECKKDFSLALEMTSE
jgi:hypothetical protein